MDTVILRIKETGYIYKYDRYNSLEIAAINYQIQTNIDAPGTAVDCMDNLLCCIGKNEPGQSINISFNEKTRCYDISIALDEELLPEWLLFDTQELLQAQKMEYKQRKQLFEKAIARSYEELEKII